MYVKDFSHTRIYVAKHNLTYRDLIVKIEKQGYLTGYVAGTSIQGNGDFVTTDLSEDTFLNNSAAVSGVSAPAATT